MADHVRLDRRSRGPRLFGALAVVVAWASIWPMAATALTDGLSAGDAAVRDFVLAHRWPPVEWFMLSVSWISSEYVTPLVLGGVFAILWRRGGEARPMAMSLAGIVVTSGLWQIILKHLVGRPRPLPVVYTAWQGFGFPSGHALTALVLVFVLWRAAAWLGAGARISRILGWVAVVWPVLVAASRVYLNCHYLSDVLAGLFLGVGHLGLVLVAFAPPWLTEVRPIDH